jgi:hypothetical protein
MSPFPMCEAEEADSGVLVYGMKRGEWMKGLAYLINRRRALEL